MRGYLEYAATGRVESGKVTGRATESPFEEHVQERLVDAGYEAVPQVGVAGFRIDLGIRHDDYPHGFLLGVECDGATYHSAKSVRDRDRLREIVLRDLGWDIYRIWSTDWFNNPNREMDKLIEHLEARRRQFREGAETTAKPLAGTVVETGADQHPQFASSTGEPTSGVDEAPDQDEIVDVGDTVFYRGPGDGAAPRRVSIVSGVDDPDRGIIDNLKPLSVALLGASVGETVTVRQPNSRVEFTVERIQKDGTAPPYPDGISAPGVDGLAPYRAWSGPVPDPRDASTSRGRRRLA